MTPECIFVPGLASPESAAYSAGHARNVELAIAHGLTPHGLTYAGHGQMSGGRIDGELNLYGAKSAVESVLSAAPHGSHVVCRSFGCMALLATMAGRPDLAARLAKVVLWAPVPFHQMWSLFGPGRESDQTAARNRTSGVRLSGDFFQSLEPVEINVTALNLPHLEVVLACGSEDPHVGEAFLRQLALQLDATRRVDVRVVHGVGHNVDHAIRPDLGRAFEDTIWSGVEPLVENSNVAAD